MSARMNSKLLVPIPGTDHFVPIGALRESFGNALGRVPQVPHNAASTGRRMGDWRPTGSGPNSVVAASQPELVRRSRDSRRNNPIAKRALDLYGVHIVGTGIGMRSACRNKKLREQLTELWKEQVKYMDADGHLPYYGQQTLAVSEMAEGSECFGRYRTRRKSDGLPVPLQLQLLPTEQVPLTYTQTFGGNGIVQGIERDAISRRTAYWVYQQNPGEAAVIPGSISYQPVRIPAGEMMHLFNAMGRIGQLRGLPWLAAGITTLFQVNSFVDAELLRKQMVANIVGFVKKATGKDVDEEDLAKHWGEVLKEYGGELPAVAMEPGTMQYLDLGEDVQFTQPADVGGSFDPFLGWNYRNVASAAGLLYEELTGNWKDMNDRTYRAAFNTFKRQVRQWQWNLVVHQMNEPTWRKFVDYAVGYGIVKVPKSVSDADLYAVTHHPERWEYVNAKQDVEAVLMEVEGGLTSREDVVAERGDDIEEVDTKRARDQARQLSLGLPEPKRGKQAPAVQPGADE